MQDTRRQVVIALRWLPLILIGALVAGALAYVFASGQPKVYEATARLMVSPGAAPSGDDLNLAESAAVRYAGQAVSRGVAEAVIAELGLPENAKSLLARTSTAVTEDSFAAGHQRSRRGPGSRPPDCTDLRQRDGAARQVHTPHPRGEDGRPSHRGQQAADQESLEPLRLTPAEAEQDGAGPRAPSSTCPVQISALELNNQALQPSSSAFVRNRLDWVEQPTDARITGGTASAVLDAACARRRRHAGGGSRRSCWSTCASYNKVRDERDLEAATGLPALGSVSERRGDIKRGDAERLVMLRYPRGGTAEAYRGLLTRVGFASGPARTLMVASADSSDGKSAVAANLALAYAEAGRNVILVDADYRSPRLHSFFGVRNDRGFTNVLVDYDVPLGWVLVPTAHPRLRLVPAGPPPPRVSAALGTRQVDALVTGLLQVADMVIFAGPAIAGSLDAAVLASHLQEVALVVPLGARADDAAEAARTLQGAEAEVVGTILYRRVRGAHKRSDAAPLPVASPGQAATWPAPPSPPRRIPAVVPKADPSAPTSPLGAAAPPAGPAAFPAASGNGQYRPPAATGATPAAATPPQPTTGPYATPFGQGGASTDR